MSAFVRRVFVAPEHGRARLSVGNSVHVARAAYGQMGVMHLHSSAQLYLPTLRDKEQHLADLARTQDQDSPEGKPTLPCMGRVRSAAGERKGPRGDAQGQRSGCSHDCANWLLR